MDGKHLTQITPSAQDPLDECYVMYIHHNERMRKKLRSSFLWVLLDEHRGGLQLLGTGARIVGVWS
jgi:hypothetical protein